MKLRYVPNMKVDVIGGTLAGALTTVLIWVFQTFLKVDVPILVANSLVVIFTFIVSFFIPLKLQNNEDDTSFRKPINKS